MHIRRAGVILSVLLAVLFMAAAQPAKAGADDFIISSFEADYYLSQDDTRASQLRVEEYITAQFPQFDQNHGILRAITQTYQGHPLDVEIQEVTQPNGTPWNYTTYTENDNLVLQIGDSDTFVHGVQTYKISYTMRNVTQNFEDHDEFYWDVNGDQWRQRFDHTQARVHIPAELAGSLQEHARCFTGGHGSTAQDCTIESRDQGETVITISATETLQPNETLTFVIGFAKDTFAPYRVPLSMILGIIFLGVLPPLAALVFVVRNWRRYGRDPKGKGIIVPQYLPPKEMSVLGSSAVLKEKFVPEAISAQIIDLAVRHYLKVYEVKEKKILKDKIDYELELVRDPKDLGYAERQVIALLFGTGASVGKRVALKKLANKLYDKAKKLGKSINKLCAEGGYFRTTPGKAKRPYIIWGLVLMAAGFVFMPFTLGISVAGAIILLANFVMPARTLKGVGLRDYLYGLRDYMELAEAERIKILQSPQGQLTEKTQIDPQDKRQLVKLYEKLLPYAMLFGIEKEWAKQFASLYTEQPDWYVGSGVFNAVVFAGALHSFNTISTTNFTPPSSSSSSGFGGGGFSGGGGGGGGGGGW